MSTRWRCWPRAEVLAAGHVMLVLAGLACACGSGSSTEAPDELVGRIEVVEYQRDDAWGGVGARFEEVSSAERDVVSDETCRVYELACAGSAGPCPLPPGIAVGTLRIRGLWAPLDLEPDSQGFYYAPDPPADLFADSAAISASVEGDAVRFSLATTGVEPLQSSLAGADLPPFGDDPVTFSWIPGTDGSQVRLHLNVANMCHAAPDWFVLECRTEDIGSLTVADSILDALPADYGGCGGTLGRYRSDEVAEDGRRIELLVGNADLFDLYRIR